MVHVEITDIANQYEIWRNTALHKHKNSIPTWDEWQNSAQKATTEAITVFHETT